MRPTNPNAISICIAGISPIPSILKRICGSLFRRLAGEAERDITHCRTIFLLWRTGIPTIWTTCIPLSPTRTSWRSSEKHQSKGNIKPFWNDIAFFLSGQHRHVQRQLIKDKKFNRNFCSRTSNVIIS